MSTSLKSEIEQYVNYFQDGSNLNESNYEEAICMFRSEWTSQWKCIDVKKWRIDYRSFDNLIHQYASALRLYSAALYNTKKYNKNNVEEFKQWVSEFKKKKRVRDLDLASLYHNLAFLMTSRTDYDTEEPISCFIECIYYLSRAFNTNSPSYFDAFAFRKCNKYLFDSLKDETLNFSSPRVFNDPFDCPVIRLHHSEDHIRKLVAEAYGRLLKVACFSRNNFIKQHMENLQNDTCRPEYLNTLMWAHYADSYKGVCIHYYFSGDVFRNFNDEYFFSHNRISYVDNDEFTKFSLNKLPAEHAFFTKSKDWNYEREMRIICFKRDNPSDHIQIPIPNCIKAVYFGLNCNKADKIKIINILSEKRCRIRKPIKKNGNCGYDIDMLPIKFYQMVYSDYFGQLEAKELMRSDLDEILSQRPKKYVRKIKKFLRRFCIWNLKNK